MFINSGVTNTLIKSMQISLLFFTNTIIIYCVYNVFHMTVKSVIVQQQQLSLKF